MTDCAMAASPARAAGFFLLTLMTAMWTLTPSAADSDARMYRSLGKARELDILRVLNINESLRGVGETEGPIAGLSAWRLHSGFNQVQVPADEAQKFIRNINNALSAFFIFRASRKSISTLISIHLPGKISPLLRVSLNPRSNRIVVSYVTSSMDSNQEETSNNLDDFSESGDQVTSEDVHHVHFDIPPSVTHGWTWLAITISPNRATLFVNCEKQMETRLNGSANMRFPPESLIYFRQEPGVKRKLLGSVQVAKLVSRNLKHRPWQCDPDGRPVIAASEAFSIDDDEEDEEYGEQIQCQYDVEELNAEIKSLQVNLTAMKEANANISLAMKDLLDMCVCRPPCYANDQRYRDGEVWYPDDCTVCACQAGEITCQTNLHKEECQPTCPKDYCYNGGRCYFDVRTRDNRCSCPEGFTGPRCGTYVSPCIPHDYSLCTSTERLWYFNWLTGECEQMTEPGCQGSFPGFLTLSDCQQGCTQGPCCFRSIASPDPRDRAHLKCKYRTFEECRGLCFSPEVEVVSFHAGWRCQEDGGECQSPYAAEECSVGGSSHLPGSLFQHGCESCRCQEHGVYECSCTSLVARKEVRDLTFEELRRFQKAVSTLRLSGSGNIWEQMRDMYVNHVMHSHDIPYYLPWHRLFIRQFERHLQDIDCSVTLPYFDFTTEVGNFSDSIVWQPNYFGGDGYGSNRCVPDHPFRGENFTQWSPCLKRRLNVWAHMPNMIDIARAIATPDFEEFSLQMQTMVQYIKIAIGGHMNEPGAPYDPLFYSVHAFIDLIFWKWQQRHGREDISYYPDDYLDIPMLPFNVAPRQVMSSEKDMCVTYIEPSLGCPCNITSEYDQIHVPGAFDSKGHGWEENQDPDGNTDEYDSDGFDREGYDRNGYDRRGYNRFGFQRNGFNRDCIDMEGYDCQGFDRYGFDRQGRHKFGYHRNGGPDISTTSRDTDLADRGILHEGYDQYGFNLDGLDASGCNYRFKGPFVLIMLYRIYQVLHHQPLDFLNSFPRTCGDLEDLPEVWYTQRGNASHNFKHPTFSHSLGDQVSYPEDTVWTEKFCFPADRILIPISCAPENIASCDGKTIFESSCQYYPHAKPIVSFCNDCEEQFEVNGQPVDCDTPPNYCSPNPCENGGTCLPSKWPLKPELVVCHCAPGFEGKFCEQRTSSTGRCYLPVDTGSDRCNENLQRWYFNVETDECESFTYSGCKGNSNNFGSYYECRITCIIGACCFKSPSHPERLYGYDSEGYDRYGFNIDGKNRQGQKRLNSNSYGGERGIFAYNGYDYQGYDRYGFNKKGLDRLGYNRRGFHHSTGFNLTGYDSFGDHDGIIDFSAEGYDSEGYNRSGYNCHNYNRDRWNVFGLSSGWSYDCRAMSLEDCQRIESEYPHLKTRVVRFTLGKRCDEVQCDEMCGCEFLGKSLKFGETFEMGCGTCECNKYASVVCSCNTKYSRKEVRDLSRSDVLRFQKAVKRLQSKNKWQELAQIYAAHLPQSHGNPQYFPWHRFYLRLVEMELQAVDCAVTIPYFDWTMDVGDLHNSVVWQANYFGGNGNPKDNYCVSSHPFQDNVEEPWTLCLRRNFNTSIYLPDAIDISVVLQSKTYEELRVKLEAISSMFHLFVGGHMGTPEAAYDPIFLSHYAFIDKLWVDWESRRNDIPQYPPELRYIPMDPFSVTPDDVLDSETQMCIEYLSPSKGAPCTRNDLDQGNLDTVPEYDVYGYDQEGYHRSGYDRLGWDRQGYGRDFFDRDGFDRGGFDRSGYDKYGFDENGCSAFGFCISRGIPNPNPQLYYPIANVRYGYLNLGIDPSGFVQYGFDSSPTDSEYCDFHLKNQIYTLYKKWIDEQMSNISSIKAFNVERFCLPVSDIPKWWLKLLWLGDKTEERVIEDLKNTFQLRHFGDPSYHSSLDKNAFGHAWLPPTPDQRFCFPLHYYSGCNLGQSIAGCSMDVCSNASCPAFPNAVCIAKPCDGLCKIGFHDPHTGDAVNCNLAKCVDAKNREREHDDTWEEEGCRVCRCKNGNVFCHPVACAPLSCTHPVTLPAQCCPRCDGCSYLSETYSNGAFFIDKKNPCNRCSCENGTVKCQSVTCPPILWCDSRSLVTPKGHCCPICAMCGSRHHGSKWREDPCTICTCNEGKIECEKENCSSIHCTHPVRTAECCPRCTDCEYQGMRISNGQDHHPDPCTKCTCKNGNVQCVTVRCPPLNCAKHATRPGECCPSCATECTFEGKTYNHGDIFLSNSNPCVNCSCKNATVDCIPISCETSHLRCNHPITPPGECCPTSCPTCTVNGKVHQSGDEWRSEDGECQICQCLEGLTVCRKKSVCRVTCTHGTRPKNSCCSPCTDCLYNGQVIENGQAFSSMNDPCIVCRCVSGNIQCSSVRDNCPSLQCKKTEIKEGACCPVCKGCKDDEGRYLLHGQRWVSPLDVCQGCTCTEGVISCERIKCDVKCRHPMMYNSVCCPQCDGCYYEGKPYYNHAQVQTDDPCLQCVCNNGNVECDSIRCPPVTCASPKVNPNECCPVCEDCLVEGKSYKHNEIFTLLKDPCLNCTCKKGNVDCSRVDQYCNPQCSHPIRLTNQCCPVCDGCEYVNKKYRNGEEFHPNEVDECTKCICQNGFVTCSKIECQPVYCPNQVNPIKILGKCCLECPTSCFVDNNEYKNGDVWLDPNDKCRQCTCKDSVVQCFPFPCPEVPCLHPATPYSKCCPKCEHCEFNRQLYRDGQSFISSKDPCQSCKCNKGNVTCETIQCEEIRCSRPKIIPNQCCPECSTIDICRFNGKIYSEKETFENPQDPCQQCVCNEGKISCYQLPCPDANCPNPLQEKCCLSCTGCSYAGQSFANGKTFKDPVDGCRQCSCKNGTVTCLRQPCPAVICRRPVPDADGCCDICQECYFQGHRYEKDEVFANPSNPCEQCHCQYPDVKCQNTVCPNTSCLHPMPEICCKECKDCMYQGTIYSNEETFVNPADSCEICKCQNGTVTCKPKECPTITCSYPVKEHCCPECNGCTYDSLNLYNWQTFVDPLDNCLECICRDGGVTCKEKRCPIASCSHPIRRHCCDECFDCLHDGKIIQNGQAFLNETDLCSECKCHDGSIRCERIACLPVRCSHPVQDGCCPTCEKGCYFENRLYDLGEEFNNPRDECQICRCVQGTVHCALKPCPVPVCSHPVPGNCCPECRGPCFFLGIFEENGSFFEHPTDLCQECHCQDSSVRCKRKQCPPLECPHPARGDCCATCEHCEYFGKFWENGAVFVNPNNLCENCECQKGYVKCSPPPCPPLTCSNWEIPEGKCCPVCKETCEYGNRVYNNGDTFSPASNPCITCTCLDGRVNCESLVCPHCTFPKRNPGECCPSCTDCTYKNLDYANGQKFMDPDSPCQECLCENGNVICKSVICPPPPCANPVVPDGACCPVCSACTVAGRIYEEGSVFLNPQDLCENCTCSRGEIVCIRQVCQQTCSHPVPDVCCPQCKGCYYENALYKDNEKFKPDPCMLCLCSEGNVKCVQEECPKLNCALQIKLPDQCCPVCRGCVHEGQEHPSGSTWTSPLNPCLSCQCQGGVITCAELQCVVPCINPQPVPGQCCPICPACKVDGKIYHSGETFSPKDNPCEICTCEAEGLWCLTHQCPALVDCPKESVLPPSEGECCPTCAGFGTNCTKEHIGTIVHPSSDPCFTCTCNDDFSWICVLQDCPLLRCPSSEVLHEKGECCAKCKVCVTNDGEVYQHGEQWSSPLEPCLVCHCKYGKIECIQLQCDERECSNGEVLKTYSGECCPSCVSQSALKCKYGRRIYEDGELWNPDVCTKCQCRHGTMVCRTERCIPLDCPSDEIPYVNPGYCCPKCVPRPATCIAFGDPHYRTFDGAMINFQGTCRYTLAADCKTGNFTVEVQNSDRGIPGVAWTETVFLKTRNLSIILGRGSLVLVNGILVNLPYLREPELFIENTGSSILVNTDVGIKVLWNGDSHVEVSVLGSYKKHMCGLCGNFNNFPHDDMRTESGQIIHSEAIFGNSWKTKDDQLSSCKPEANDIDPCAKGGYWARKIATTKCSVLKGPLFAKCHHLIPPEPYFASCVYDLCACSENDACLCDILSTYSQECSHAGVTLNWRTGALCAITCSFEDGLVFDECGPACPRTCENKDLPPRVLAAQCFKPCVAGCQCPADKVLHDGKCIPIRDCP